MFSELLTEVLFVTGPVTSHDKQKEQQESPVLHL